MEKRRELKEVRFDAEYMQQELELYHDVVDEAYKNFVSGCIEAGRKRGASRLELLRELTNVLKEAGWSDHDIGFVLKSVKSEMDAIHFN